MAKNNKSEQKLEEANFEASSLSEVKDENGNGIFHMQTKTKIIIAISSIILAITIFLIYLTVENYFVAEMWQVIIWGLCGILSLYSIFSRSLPALLLNIVLFAGVSFLPTWQSGYKTAQPVIEKVSDFMNEKNSESVEDAPPVENKTENKPAVIEKNKSETAKTEDEKIIEDKSAEVEENKSEKIAPQKLPSI